MVFISKAKTMDKIKTALRIISKIVCPWSV